MLPVLLSIKVRRRMVNSCCNAFPPDSFMRHNDLAMTTGEPLRNNICVCASTSAMKLNILLSRIHAKNSNQDFKAFFSEI